MTGDKRGLPEFGFARAGSPKLAHRSTPKLVGGHVDEALPNAGVGQGGAEV